MIHLFDIGDIVRLKPRGHKMIVCFIYNPQCQGIYLALYHNMRLKYPEASCFYVCKNPKTGKTIDKIYPENLLEKV